MIVVDFTKAMFGNLTKPWWIWIGALMIANMLLPMFFIDTLEAKMVLLAAVTGAILQMGIFRRLGFVRLLGIGHLPWVPLVLWLYGRLASVGSEPGLRAWITVVLVLNVISLVIDAVDVARYAVGHSAQSRQT